ncbi:MAG: nitronate monooxygenase [Bacteroidales bacterium]|nr:nitronate monooxygenase [Bacteroidales bacterium]NLK82233.1 nitronate monooxygenase [Bacteroidales bacterium]
MRNSKICQLFSIQYPIIQGGMVWCSGWKLAAAVSNAGGLGLLGSGSMYPEVLREHISKMKIATNKPWGVNIPLLYPEIDTIIDIVITEGVKIVFTSAGSPKIWTKILQNHGIIVVHVVSSALFAKKCEEAGVDAIVAEGFEAGGHNGKDETTTFSLIPHVRETTTLPLIAAGGIARGEHMCAAMILGADGVQIGSRFAVCKESSAHDNFKQAVYKANEGDTFLSLKQISPTRMLKNPFFERVHSLEQNGASVEMLKDLLGKGRAKKGIFEGDIEQGELEIGQGATYSTHEQTAAEIIQEIVAAYTTKVKHIKTNMFDI